MPLDQLTLEDQVSIYLHRLDLPQEEMYFYILGN